MFFLFLSSTLFLNSQSGNLIYKGDTENYFLVERSDLRKYENGKYKGLTSREVRSLVNPVQPPKNANERTRADQWFSGDFMVLEQTKTSGVTIGKSINDIIPSLFHISKTGELTVVPKDRGFPTYRSFPTFPDRPVQKGDSWTGKAYRAVDPLNRGIFTILQVMVQYTFAGETVYKGIPVYQLKAKWATRYGDGTLYYDYEGDESLIKATGSHNADIMVSIETGAAILIRDNLDEIFYYDDGQNIRYKGSTLLFTEFPPAVNREEIIPAIEKIASIADGQNEKESPDQPVPEDADSIPVSEENLLPELSPDRKKDTVMEETEKGIKLSIRNLQFVADSSRLLPGEKERLDDIADILKMAPGSTFLVEGYSASTGNPAGEKKLSEERAAKIVEELIKRGISSNQFIYMGRGSENPIGENSTKEGKAQNRRVEITILE